MKDEKHLGADAAAVVSAGSIERDQLSHAAPTHTPGPWVVRYIEGGGYDTLSSAYRILHGPDEDNDRVCEVDTRDYDDRIEDEDTHYGVETSARAEANAHLIAAAPEMYAALKDAIDGGFACPEPMLDRMRAAIAKANGEQK
jgi:hypothetical protein